MSEISRLATAFEQRSKAQAADTEKAVRSAFENYENALIEALNESEKTTSAAIRAQSRNLQRTALRSWLAVTIPVCLSLLLGVGAIAAMSWYIAGQINEITSHNATLERLAQEGGAMQVSYCGDQRRLCVRIDESAETYQNGYRILEGY